MGDHGDAYQTLDIPDHLDPQDFFSVHTTGGVSQSEVILMEQEKSMLATQHFIPSTSVVFQAVEVPKSSRVLTLAFVLPICYFLMCGGPSGVEPVVTSGGPLLALIGLVIFPIVFSVPLGLLVSEMCTAFPDDGGFVIWVTNAFGPFWGFQEGFLYWVSTVLNNALYPTFVLQSLANIIGKIHSPVVEYVVKIAIVLVVSLPTLLGTRIVGKTSVVLAILVVFPFMVATVWFFAEAKDFGVWGAMPNGSSVHGELTEVDWKALVTNIFWYYDDFYLVSLFGGQIANPCYTYPRVIFITLLLTAITYVVPLAGALVVDRVPWWEFEDESMQQIAKLLGGTGFHVMMVLSAVCSSIGLFTADTFAQCYLVSGMAQTQLVPKGLAKRHELFDTPHLALLVNMVPVLFLLAVDTDTLLNAANCLSAAAQVLMIAAAVKLRLMHSDMYQFKMFPGGNLVAVLSMLIPMAVVGFVFAVSLRYIAVGVVVVSVACGLIKSLTSDCTS